MVQTTLLKQGRLLDKIMSVRQMSEDISKAEQEMQEEGKAFAFNQQLSLAFGVFHTVAQGIVVPRH